MRKLRSTTKRSHSSLDDLSTHAPQLRSSPRHVANGDGAVNKSVSRGSGTAGKSTESVLKIDFTKYYTPLSKAIFPPPLEGNDLSATLFAQTCERLKKEGKNQKDIEEAGEDNGNDSDRSLKDGYLERYFKLNPGEVPSQGVKKLLIEIVALSTEVIHKRGKRRLPKDHPLRLKDFSNKTKKFPMHRDYEEEYIPMNKIKFPPIEILSKSSSSYLEEYSDDDVDDDDSSNYRPHRKRARMNQDACSYGLRTRSSEVSEEKNTSRSNQETNVEKSLRHLSPREKYMEIFFRINPMGIPCLRARKILEERTGLSVHATRKRANRRREAEERRKRCNEEKQATEEYEMNVETGDESENEDAPETSEENPSLFRADKKAAPLRVSPRLAQDPFTAAPSLPRNTRRNKALAHIPCLKLTDQEKKEMIRLTDHEQDINAGVPKNMELSHWNCVVDEDVKVFEETTSKLTWNDILLPIHRLVSIHNKKSSPEKHVALIDPTQENEGGLSIFFEVEGCSKFVMPFHDVGRTHFFVLFFDKVKQSIFMADPMLYGKDILLENCPLATIRDFAKKLQMVDPKIMYFTGNHLSGQRLTNSCGVHVVAFCHYFLENVLEFPSAYMNVNAILLRKQMRKFISDLFEIRNERDEIHGRQT